MKTTFRSIFLTSDHPDRTAQFYQEVALLALEAVGEEGGYRYWRLDDGQLQIAIHDATSFSGYTHPPVPNSNLTHLYFTIESLDEFEQHLKQRGVHPHAVDDVVITVVDPDGRKVMFGIA